MMKKNKMTFLVFLFSSLFSIASNAVEGFDVIVNPSVKLTSMTKDEVKQILLANKTSWPDGKPISLISLAFDTSEEEKITKEFMAMTGVQAKKHYLTKVFSGILANQPASGETVDEVAELVAKTSGAMAVVPKGSPAGKAKVIPIQ